MSPEVALRLAPNALAPRAARRALVDGMALQDGLAKDAALLVTEAVTNSVLHAGLAAEDRISVAARWAGSSLRVEVWDAGCGLHDPAPEDADREGGRGLNIIAAIAERWGVLSNGHTSVWFELAG